MLLRALGRGQHLLRPARAAACTPPLRPTLGRALCSRGRDDYLSEDEEKNLMRGFAERLSSPAELQPQFRKPVPPVPDTHVESWVPASRAAPPSEAPLTFESRYYLESGGDQTEGARRVKVHVRVDRLGLTEAEVRRLVAVACRGSNFDRRARVLKLSCDKHPLPAQNKDELRRMVGRLVADAKENAEAHAKTPGHELPLIDRERPWWPDDRRAYRGRRKRWKYHAPG